MFVKWLGSVKDGIVVFRVHGTILVKIVILGPVPKVTMLP